LIAGKGNMNGSRWTSLGALFCLFSVAFGAFAAHGLDRVFVEKYAGRSREVGGQTLPLAAKFLNDFKTGAEYQMYHGLALIAVGLILDRRPSRAARIAAWMFAAGIVLFSGSLYVLTLTGVTKWGAVTPFGGLAFLLGWFFLSLDAMGKPAATVPESLNLAH
jgi:uncharacterized membrane protein YgdD (TMEM256/DUF423 family)